MPKSIELAIGAALLSHLLLALLWFGWAAPWLVAGLFLAGAGWGIWRRGPVWRQEFRMQDAVFLPFAILYLVYALAPETSSDAIAYHLGLPAEWLRTGSLARRTSGFFDVIPHGLETLFMAAAAVGGFTAAKLVHFAFLLATPPLMIRVAAKLGFDGRPAALLYFVSPVVAMAGTSAYNDVALAFYGLATLWLLLEEEWAWAGLTAGFCYAIKMPGGVVTLAVGLYLLRRRAWGGLAWAVAMVAPWLVHSWWLSGNPVAPMLLTVFPSAEFYPVTVTGWTDYVRSYGVPWSERAWEVTLGGARTQGLLGPGFLLAPIGLLAMRRKKDAVLVAAAAVCAAGWFFNAGTRFLIPAAVFAALAMAAALPRKLAWALALVHAVLCWPVVLDRYVPAGAWRLSAEWPWRAALRIEPELDYLRRTSPQFQAAEMVNRHVKPGERVLDFSEVPRAYAQGAELLLGWQYPVARRAAAALVTAHSGEPHVFYQLHGSWPRRRLRSMRFEQYSTSEDSWSIQEVRLRRGGGIVFPSRAWELSAHPNPWDAALAFDRNLVSGWRTWEPRRDGMYLEIAGSIDSDGVELVCLGNEAGPRVRVSGVDERGLAVELAARLEPREAVALNRRMEAMRYVRREGFAWIVTATGEAGLDQIGRALVDEAADWGVERVDRSGGVYLLRIVN